jgi:hypothetical protein
MRDGHLIGEREEGVHRNPGRRSGGLRSGADGASPA